MACICDICIHKEVCEWRVGKLYTDFTKCSDYIPEGAYKWVPVTFRPMTEEEVKEVCEKWGIKENCLDEIDKRVFTCPLPEDGQEILISHGGLVTEDICSWDEDFCGLEYYGDWDGVDAWMLPPEPYKKGET